MKKSIRELKSYFEAGDSPTEVQFANLIDSLATPMIGEIRTVSFDTAPKGWAKCDGQLLSIYGNETLFRLIGTTYGGNGTDTFALPDLKGRMPIHIGTGEGLSKIDLGQKEGSETKVLSVSELPSHTHSGEMRVSSSPDDDDVPSGNVAIGAAEIFSGNATNVSLSSETIGISPTGEQQAFNIRNPFLGINYVIALEGIDPLVNL
jgi:microcystin-dependent protein